MPCDNNLTDLCKKNYINWGNITDSNSKIDCDNDLSMKTMNERENLRDSYARAWAVIDAVPTYYWN